MSKKILFCLALSLASFFCVSQDLYLHRDGDTLSFYIPTTGTQETVTIDSVIISRLNNRVICDLKQSSRWVRISFPKKEILLPAKELNIEKYKIGTYALLATLIDTIDFTGNAVYYLPFSQRTEAFTSAVLSPTKESSFQKLIGYRYQGFQSLKTKSHTTVSFADNAFSIKREVTEKQIVPWEIILSMIIICLTTIKANKVYHLWKNRKDYLDDIHAHESHRKIDYGSTPLYASIALFIVSQMPTISFHGYGKFELIFLSIICLLLLMMIFILIFAVISSALLKLGRWYGLAFLALAQVAILWEMYDFSYLLPLIPLSILPAVLLNSRIKNKWCKLSTEQEAEMIGEDNKRYCYQDPLMITSRKPKE
ncbi:MAG: hypothetical protein ACM3PZ_02645 [Bacillota bacterium]